MAHGPLVLIFDLESYKDVLRQPFYHQQHVPSFCFILLRLESICQYEPRQFALSTDSFYLDAPFYNH